jgi:hypothetical protein
MVVEDGDADGEASEFKQKVLAVLKEKLFWKEVIQTLARRVLTLLSQFNMADIHFSWLEVQMLLLFIWSLTQFCLLFAWLQKILFMVFFQMVEFEHWFQDVNSPLY